MLFLIQQVKILKLGDDAKPLHNMTDYEWQDLFGHNTDLLFNVARTSIRIFIKS